MLRPINLQRPFPPGVESDSGVMSGRLPGGVLHPAAKAKSSQFQADMRSRWQRLREEYARPGRRDFLQISDDGFRIIRAARDANFDQVGAKPARFGAAIDHSPITVTS